jgi:hypothetical protein
MQSAIGFMSGVFPHSLPHALQAVRHASASAMKGLFIGLLQVVSVELSPYFTAVS